MDYQVPQYKLALNPLCRAEAYPIPSAAGTLQGLDDPVLLVEEFNGGIRTPSIDYGQGATSVRTEPDWVLRLA